MKLGYFLKNNKKFYGVLQEEIIKKISGNIFAKFKITEETYNLKEVKILPPVNPSKIICVGLNYFDHAKEFKQKIPAEPLIFLKAPSAVIASGENIVLPPNCKQVDYEGELAVVIKKTCKNVSPQEAKNFILGYSCLNDVTERVLQKKDGQWSRAKSFDTFCPLGAVIETEINPNNLEIKTYLNGEIKQNSNTKNLIFPVFNLISFISCIMTLFPGDVISTGTPSGVGPLKNKDEVVVEISGIGKLINYVVQ